jgi:hypothetical protein
MKNYSSAYFNPSKTLEFKMQLLSRTEQFLIYSILNCSHCCTVTETGSVWRDYRSVQCTETASEGLKHYKTNINVFLILCCLIKESHRMNSDKSKLICSQASISFHLKVGRGSDVYGN